MNALNELKVAAYRSLNGSIGWIGIAATPFCAFGSSDLQQRTPNLTVRDLVLQINMIRKLEKLGSVIRHKRPSDSKEDRISILVFSDASRTPESGQLGFVVGLLIGDFQEKSIFHTLHWGSRKSSRPVRSTGAAETLAAGSAIDEGKILKRAMSTLLGIQVDQIIELLFKGFEDYAIHVPICY